MINTVQVTPKLNPPKMPFRNRVYYPVKGLRGPKLRVCNDYIEFMKYYGKDSLAQLILDKGYQLLCHRVSYVPNKSNATLYSYGNKLVDTVASSTLPDFEVPLFGKKFINLNESLDKHYSSLILKFNKNFNDFNSNYYMLLNYSVANGVLSSKSDRIAGLFSNRYVLSKGDSYDQGVTAITTMFGLKPSSNSIFLKNYRIDEHGYYEGSIEDLEGMKKYVKYLFTMNGFDVLDQGCDTIVVSVHSPHSIQFSSSNPDIFEYIKQDNYYENKYLSNALYSNRFISISSKYPDASNNINFEITKISNRYRLNISIDDSEYKEHYLILKEDLENNLIKSDIVDIDYFHSDKIDNLSTKFKLYSTEPGYYDDEYALEAIRSLNDGDSDIIQADICLDPIGSKDSIKALHDVFPWAVIVSTCNETQSRSDDLWNTMTLHPKELYDIKHLMRVPSYMMLFDTLPDLALNDRSNYVFTDDYDSDIESKSLCTIKEEPLGLELTDLKVYNKNINYPEYPLLPALARAAVYRVCTEIDPTTKEDIDNQIYEAVNNISKLLNIDMLVDIDSTINGVLYRANILLKIENLDFNQFNINAEILYG